MYIPKHLKWRILIARALKKFFYEPENAGRNYQCTFDLFAKFLLGTTYDTFLSYLKEDRYVVTDRKLPPYILADLALLDAMRTACERLHLRKPDRSWPLTAIAEEMLAVLHEEEEQQKSLPKIHID